MISKSKLMMVGYRLADMVLESAESNPAFQLLAVPLANKLNSAMNDLYSVQDWVQPAEEEDEPKFVAYAESENVHKFDARWYSSFNILEHEFDGRGAVQQGVLDWINDTLEGMSEDHIDELLFVATNMAVRSDGTRLELGYWDGKFQSLTQITKAATDVSVATIILEWLT